MGEKFENDLILNILKNLEGKQESNNLAMLKFIGDHSELHRVENAENIKRLNNVYVRINEEVSKRDKRIETLIDNMQNVFNKQSLIEQKQDEICNDMNDNRNNKKVIFSYVISFLLVISTALLAWLGLK